VLQKGSSSGYIDDEIICDWCEFLIKKIEPIRGDPSLWALLIIDGHHCHTLNPKALRILNNAHIIAVSIPAHSSAYLQVHDVSIFGPFKRYFNSEMSEYIRLNSPKLKLRELAPIIEDPWYHASTKNIRAGFQKVGLWPLNPSWLEPKSKDLKILTVTSQEEKFYTLCNRALNEMSRHQLLSRLDALDIASDGNHQ